MQEKSYKICVVTSTRADFGIMSGLLKKMKADPQLEMTLVVTGTHLKKEYGNTVDEIYQEGFQEITTIDIMETGKTWDATFVAAEALHKFGEFFQKEKPELLLVLGDRSEIMAVSMAALLNQIPIAHLHGGEKTEGAVDEACRHAITKMSQLHFTATEGYRNRVVQLGEQPERVYNVGALGVENIRKISLFSKDEVYEKLTIPKDKQYVMVTFHPQTQDKQQMDMQMKPLLSVMEKHSEFYYIISKANADNGGDYINNLWEQKCEKYGNWKLFSSLGKKLYFSSLSCATMVMGNSSSGIIEVPSFHIPTIDIGDRQQGRTTAESVIHCENKFEDIEKAVQIALNGIEKGCYKSVKNPYGREGTADRIVEIIKEELSKGISTKKIFYDVECVTL